MLDDREKALAQLVEVNLLAQRRGEGFESFDRHAITQVETLLNAFLGKRAHGVKYDRPCECRGDKNDMRPGTLVYKQYPRGDDTVVDERHTNREQEIDW